MKNREEHRRNHPKNSLFHSKNPAQNLNSRNHTQNLDFKTQNHDQNGKIKVVSGYLKGKTLKTPGGATHPMGSREKLALFNMISADVVRADVLDAFAGSGALGIEALSRGARHVVFIENSPRAVEIIRENLKSLDLLESAEIYSSSVQNFVAKNFLNFSGPEKLSEIQTVPPRQTFDLILADPPYDNFNPTEIEKLLSSLKPSGKLVLSHPDSAPDFPNLTHEKSHTYAKAHISIYTKNSSTQTVA